MSSGSPSVSIREIEARQSIVSLFSSKPHVRDDIINMLKGLEDVSRIVQRLTLGRGDIEDLLNIRKAVIGWERIHARLNFERDEMLRHDGTISPGDWTNMNALLSHMVDLTSLAERIGNAIDDTDFDRKEKLAAGFDAEDDAASETDSRYPFGRPPYGVRWKLKPK